MDMIYWETNCHVIKDVSNCVTMFNTFNKKHMYKKRKINLAQ
jgi:hypothetical protein